MVRSPAPVKGMMPMPMKPLATKPLALSTRKRSPSGEPERRRRRMSDCADADDACPRARRAAQKAAAWSLVRDFMSLSRKGVGARAAEGPRAEALVGVGLQAQRRHGQPPGVHLDDRARGHVAGE